MDKIVFKNAFYFKKNNSINFKKVVIFGVLFN